MITDACETRAEASFYMASHAQGVTLSSLTVMLSIGNRTLSPGNEALHTDNGR